MNARIFITRGGRPAMGRSVVLQIFVALVERPEDAIDGAAQTRFVTVEQG